MFENRSFSLCVNVGPTRKNICAFQRIPCSRSLTLTLCPMILIISRRLSVRSVLVGLLGAAVPSVKTRRDEEKFKPRSVPAFWPGSPQRIIQQSPVSSLLPASHLSSAIARDQAPRGSMRVRKRARFLGFLSCVRKVKQCN